jgi:ankyrin repeat protein
LLARGLSSPGDLTFMLGQAAVQGFADRVRLLLAHGVAPDGTNHYNRRSHVENALLDGHAEIARQLIAAGATWPTFADHERFRIAVLANDEAEARRVLAASPTANTNSGTLIATAKHGRLASLRLALTLGVPIDGLDAQGLTALHHAARGGQLEAVRALVEHGASLTIRDPRYGGTPLGHAKHFASRWPTAHAAEIVDFLAQRSP